MGVFCFLKQVLCSAGSFFSVLIMFFFFVCFVFYLKHTIIPRGSLSLKVLAELPIIVVLMYQVSKAAPDSSLHVQTWFPLKTK